MQDQGRDGNGQILYRIARQHELPEYVKDASRQALGYPDDKPLQLLPRSYGDPTHRRFPCHTKAAAWLSYAYLLAGPEHSASGDYQPIRDRIRQLGDYYGNRADLDALEKPAEKQASAPVEHMLELRLPSGKVEKRYPLRSFAELQRAADYLEKHAYEIPLMHRQDMARRLLAVAATTQLMLDPRQTQFIEKQAGNGWCSAGDAARLLEQRALLVRSQQPELASELVEAAAACRRSPAAVRSPQSLRKLACAVDAIDRATKRTDYDGLTYERPEDVFFRINEKVAETYLDEHCASASGNIYRKSDLGRLKLADVRDTLGDAFADDVSSGGLLVCPDKLATQLHALPRPDCALLDRLLTASGVRPVAKEAAAHGAWLTPEMLEQLAGL